MAGQKRLWRGALLVLGMMMAPVTGPPGVAAVDDCRTSLPEGPDNEVQNNDDFSTAQEVASGTFVDGTTGINDSHRIDTYLLKGVPAGKVINASVHITNFDRQALLLNGWNKFHADNLAWSNREDNPERREWEALSFLCVITGDYYLRLKPLAGNGTVDYRLNIGVLDPEDITAGIGTGGSFGPAVCGNVSSVKWYPGHWYRFRLSGELDGQNDYLYVNLTEPGAPDERLSGDLYIRNLEPESWSYWLNHSWWLDSSVQYEEVHVAACRPGPAWYYLDVQACNTSGGRRENYELRLVRTLIDSDGDNHPLNATAVTYEHGKTTVRKAGNVTRGPDMFDWYKVYQKKGGGLSANLTFQERSTALFRLSVYRDNQTSPYPDKGYDLLTSWTNKPADNVLDRINALAVNVSQEGWYYVGVMAQIGLVPANVSNLADWTVQTAWARYSLVLEVEGEPSHPPQTRNSPGRIMMPEDGTDTSLELNWTGDNGGIFWEEGMDEEWGEELSFCSVCSPNLTITIDGSAPEAPATIRPKKDWNGEENITFTATDLYGRFNSTVVNVRVTPVPDPPFVKAGIPDFRVKENDVNLTMRDIDLFSVFGDPDLPPFGDDNLTFSVDGSTFQAWIIDCKLSFGQAPRFPGHGDNIVKVKVYAIDRAGLSVSVQVNITIIGFPPPLYAYNEIIEILEDEIFFFDLNNMFLDEDGGPLTFVYLGGATENLTVKMAPNGTVLLRPALLTRTSMEVLRFRAIGGSGSSATGELLVRISHHDRQPEIREMVPDPLEGVQICEGASLACRVSAIDVDTKSSDLRYTWYIDEVARTGPVGPAFTWVPGFEEAGLHFVRCRISDGLQYVDADWNITVLDTDRPPLVIEAGPANNTEVAYGTAVRFCATAIDPDGDSLTFVWRLSDGTLLKSQSGVQTSSFSKVLPGGRQHIVVLEVNDGKGGVTHEYFYIKVGFGGDVTEGPRLAFGGYAVAALVGVILILLLARRTKRNQPR